MSENVGSIVYEVDANTSGLVAASKQVEAANKSMQKGFAQTDSATASVSKGMSAANKSTKPLESGFNGVRKSSGKLGNSIRQASMQLSQVAQQGSVTGNYMQALAIQLPDLALGFGTVGIIAGALAGTIGVALLDSMNNTGEGSETLAETIDRLGNSFETADGKSNKLSGSLLDMAKIAKNVVKLRLEIEEEDALAAVRDVRLELLKLTNESTGSIGFFDVLSGVTAVDKLAKSLGITTEEAKELQEAIPSFDDSGEIESYNKLAGVVAKLEGKYDKTNSKLSEYTRSLFTFVEQGTKASQSLKDLEKANSDFNKSISDSGTFEDPEGDRLAELYANRQEAAKASIEQIRQQFQDEQTLAEEQLEERLTAIDDAQISVAEKEQAEYEARALHAQRLADLDAKRTTDEQAETAKRLTLKKMELAAYTQLGGQLTNLVAAAGAENTAIGKAVFLANQALAVAGIIVNTQAAAAAALAQGGPIAGPALAANVTTLGYTSAAIAAGVAVGQTFSGRQTGGPTEANTPYRVGEAGPELFTSGGRQFLIGGEKGNVTPTNQLGGAAAPQVNVVVNNNTSSNVSVSQEQDGNNVTIQMLVADFAEGGPVSRAMASSYNTKRKTT